MGNRGRGAAGSVWGPRDTALGMTAVAFAEWAQHRSISARVNAPFPLRPPATKAHFVGPVSLYELRADGDGTYEYNSGIAIGSGVGGAMLFFGSIAASAASKNRAKNRAVADSRLAFRHNFDADVFVTDAGFMLASMNGIVGWHHDAIDSMLMVGPGQVTMQGQSDEGPIVWQLNTPWAELLFAMWAVVRHPENRLLQDGGWFPRGWIQWARGQGRDPWDENASIAPRHELDGPAAV